VGYGNVHTHHAESGHDGLTLWKGHGPQNPLKVPQVHLRPNNARNTRRLADAARNGDIWDVCVCVQTAAYDAREQNNRRFHAN